MLEFFCKDTTFFQYPKIFLGENVENPKIFLGENVENPKIFATPTYYITDIPEINTRDQLSNPQHGCTFILVPYTLTVWALFALWKRKMLKSVCI